jgi:hypothetical protein
MNYASSSGDFRFSDFPPRTPARQLFHLLGFRHFTISLKYK